MQSRYKVEMFGPKVSLNHKRSLLFEIGIWWKFQKIKTLQKSWNFNQNVFVSKSSIFAYLFLKLLIARMFDLYSLLRNPSLITFFEFYFEKEVAYLGKEPRRPRPYHGQLLAARSCLKRAQNYSWVFFNDIDEFLWWKTEKSRPNVKQWLPKFSNYSHLTFRKRFYSREFCVRNQVPDLIFSAAVKIFQPLKSQWGSLI